MKSETAHAAPSIAFITGQLGLGGAERQLYLLIRGLIDAGWRVCVITLNPGRADYWEEPLRRLGASLQAVATDGSRPQRLLRITDILRRERADLVHSWTFHANLYAAIGGRLSGTRVRLGSERANHLCSRQAVGRFWYRFSLSGLHGVIVNSEPAADFLRSYRPHVPVSVVPNAVEIPAPPDSPTVRESRAAVRRTLGINASTCVVGAVGSLVPRKNFEALIDAVTVLCAKGYDLRLVVIGDGPLRRELEARIAPSVRSHIFLAGPIANAATWLPGFDIFCLPSRNQEGMPNVLMEASAAGLPVVATNVGGVSSVVEDRVTGYLVAPDDPNSLIAALERMAVDPNLRARLGRGGRSRMQHECGVDLMVARMIAAYRAALAAHPIDRIPSPLRPFFWSRGRNLNRRSRDQRNQAAMTVSRRLSK